MEFGMAVITLMCPHCLGMSQLKVTGYFIEVTKQQQDVALGTACPGCHMPVAVLAKRTSARNNTLDTDFNNKMNHLVASTAPIEASGLQYVDHWPKPPEPSVPTHLPPAVEKAFLQAERNYPLKGHEEAAGLMYRRSLELALGEKYPERKGTLAQIIGELVAEKILTEDLGKWATEVRLVGNDAAHALEVTKDDLEMMRGFADAVLKYVWTLPTQVQQRRTAKQPVAGAAPAQAVPAPAS
jgi:hypothetical protein